MVTGAEAARLKGVSKQAVYEAIADGRLTSTKVGGIHLIRTEDVDAWTPIGNESKNRAARPRRPRPGQTA